MKKPWELEGEAREAYWAGVLDGVRRFAWWKDGEQFAGSCGKSLAQAANEIEAEAAGRRTPYYP